MNINQKIIDMIKKGTEATAKMDDEVKNCTIKLPSYVLDSSEVVIYSTIINIDPIMMEKLTKLLMAHCNNLYRIGFLHGKEVGKEEGMEEMSNYFINADADNLKN